MTKEKALSKRIQLLCGQHDIIALDVNVGGGELVRGGYFTSGLPKGWPDLMLLTNDGRTIYVEVKVHPNRPSEDQKRTLKLLTQRKHPAFIAWSVEDFIQKMSDIGIIIKATI